VEAVFGVLAFVLLFAAWVVVPSVVKKRHAAGVSEEPKE